MWRDPVHIQQRLEAGIVKLRLATERPSLRRLGWIIGTVALGAAGLYTSRNLPPDLALEPIPLILAAISTTAVITALPLEVILIAKMAKTELDYGTAFRVNVLGSLANLAPVPGSVAVRTGSIVGRGGSLSAVLGGTFVVAAMWVGVALMMGGLAVGTSSSRSWAIAMVALGGLCIALSAIVGGRLSFSRRVILKVLSVELALVSLSALLFFFLIRSVGYPGTPTHGALVTTSSVVATATGFLPMGLGLSEILSAVAAPLVSLDPAVAILVVVLARLLNIALLAASSLVLRLVARQKSGTSDASLS